jgi:hypothetical protein
MATIAGECVLAGQELATTADMIAVAHALAGHVLHLMRLIGEPLH